MSSELESLRSLADRVHPPSFEALEDVARRRTRRTAALAALGCAVTVLVVAVGITVATATDHDSSPRPVLPLTPTPTVSQSPTTDPSQAHVSNTSMTPEEVVQADNATLELTAVSADDPDFRFSVWMAECTWCAKPDPESRFPHPYFGGLALTTDGFQTFIYRHAPWQDCRFSTPCSSLPVQVESVGPGLLLVVDDSNGYEWLVRDDGTITALDRDFDLVSAADPRMWFVCDDDLDREPNGRGPNGPQATWCALDPKANLVHIWEGPWTSTVDDSISAVSPHHGAMPWGMRDPGDPPPDPGLSAWWEVDGSRQYHDLGPATVRGVLQNPPPGVLSYWSWERGSHSMQVFTSDDRGATWRTTRLAVAFRPGTNFFDLYWTPGGALLGVQTGISSPDGSEDEGGVRVWRAELVDGGAFEVTHEASVGNDFSWFDHPFGFFGDQIWTSRMSSDDDGRTWAEVTGWRP